MTKISGSIHFELPSERLEEIIARLEKLEVICSAFVTKRKVLDQIIPQKTAMGTLGVSFPTFKAYLTEFKVRPIKRGSRLFYRSKDVERIVYGKR